METLKLEQTEDIVIECPKCDYWECAPDDIPRRKLGIVSSVSDDGRYTECECPECHHQWKLDWDECL